MNKGNNLTRVIVPSMTLDEVGDYLKETVFTDENLQKAYALLYKNSNRYKRIYKDWLFTRDKEDLFKIYNPIYYKGKYTHKLTIVPCWPKDRKDIIWIVFTRIHHNRFKGVAMWSGKTVEFYSAHSIERYSERYDGEKLKYDEIDDVYLGKMFVYNGVSFQKEYEYNDSVSIYDVVRDGVFLSYPDSKYKIIRTFISSGEFFNQQKRFFNKGIRNLNPHLLREGISPISLVA